MKAKSLFIILICFALFLTACSTTIPSSGEAKDKLEKLGYSVTLNTQFGDAVANQGIVQVTILNADQGDDFLQAYFFANEEDTKTFYSQREKSLSSGVEVVKKNKYSIYRGTQKAVDDFLS